MLLTTLALSEDMYDDGYHNIVNIDFSKTVIQNMAEKCKDRVGMECKDRTLRRYIFWISCHRHLL
jgi:hypothetical protein